MILERRYRWIRPMPGCPHILCRADAQFSTYLPSPNATLFVVTWPLVHDTMSILVPHWWIFHRKGLPRVLLWPGTGLPS